MLGGSDEDQEASQPAVQVAETEPGGEALPVTGTLTVNAYPWGEVRLEDASQAVVSLEGETCPTPCTVELDSGTYTAYVVNAAFPDTELTCEASISGGMAGTCHVVFGEATATDYFKAAGWWN